MALVQCKDCKKEFSTDAKTCPHCGANPPLTKVQEKAQEIAKGVMALVMVLLVGFCALAPKSNPVDLCQDDRQAFDVVASFAAMGSKDFEMADFSTAKFEHLPGCKIRVTSYGIRKGIRDDFSLVVAPWQPNNSDKPAFRVDLSETLK